VPGTVLSPGDTKMNILKEMTGSYNNQSIMPCSVKYAIVSIAPNESRDPEKV
jgi:hypothetical protein